MALYGIKISKEGYDVNTATKDNLVMTSEANQFKIHMQGSITFTSNNQTSTVTHNLSYTPSYMAFVKDSGGSYYYFRQGGQDYVDSTYLSFTANNGQVISYIIFKDLGA